MLINPTDIGRVRLSGLTATLAATAGSELYFSIPGMPNEAILKRITVSSDDLGVTSSNALMMKILTDPAAYRAAEATKVGTGDKDYTVQAWTALDGVSAIGPNQLWRFDSLLPDNMRYRDDSKTGSFHILIKSPGELEADTAFTVTVEADRQAEIWSGTDQNPYHSRQSYPKVLKQTVGGTWTDLSRLARNERDLNDYSFSPFAATSDYIYIGFQDLWDGVWFNVKDRNTTPTTVTCQFYNGSTWAACTVQDNCTTASNVEAIPFDHSGVVSFTNSGWARAQIGALSLTGTPPYDYPPTYGQKWDDLYWVRMKLNSVATPPTFRWIRRKPTLY